MKTTTNESKLTRAAEHDEAANEFRVMLSRYPLGREGGAPNEASFWAKAIAFNQKRSARLRALAAKG